MKEHVARPVPPARAPANQDRAEAAAGRRPVPSSHPEPQPGRDRDDRPSLLHLLRGVRLAEQWDVATGGEPVPLPGRADLERHFGVSLSRVQVHAGPAARSLLDHLGARAAASGGVILLRDGPADPVTVAHEVAHVLQSEGEGPVTEPVPADHPAEREAEAAASSRRPRRQRIRVRLRPGALALRRLGAPPGSLPVRDPAVATAERPLGAEDLRRPPAEEEPEEPTPTAARQRAPPRRPDEQQPPPPEAPAGAVPSGEEAAPEAPAAEGEAQQATEQGRAVEGEREAAQQAAPAPNRREDIQQVLDDTQATWDAASGEASDHEVAACPDHANQPGQQPFARGPPLEVPPTTDAPPEAEPEIEEPSDEALREARRELGEQVNRAPARAPPVDPATLDEDQRRERAELERQLASSIEEAVGEEDLDTVETPTLALEGQADPDRGEHDREVFTASAGAAEQAAHQGAEENFGEHHLAPHTDPTTALDASLDRLEISEVDVAVEIEQARLDLVATDANAGTVPIDQVVLVTDSDFDASRVAAEAQERAREQIDTEIAGSDQAVERACARAGRGRETIQAASNQGVGTRRERWVDAVDHHVARRTGEGERMAEDKLGRVRTIERDTNTAASHEIETARNDAQRSWRDTQHRAAAKADQADDRSWWERGIDWVRARIADLVSWIDAFIDACRDAINSMLDAASALAHAIVDAGHAAITATINGLHAGLDFLADNLPGELGEIANEYREDIHEFLDGVQADVDAWADDLHQDIDESIEDLRADLNETLDDIQDGVHDVADTIDDILENGLMAWLRREYPDLAALIDEGLLSPVRRAGDKLGEWLNAAVEATGLGELQRSLAEIDASGICEPATEEEQAEDCAALEQTLQGALESIDAILASPLAQRIQSFLQESRDEAAAQQVDAVSGFFDFIAAVARPVYDWWQRVEPTVERVLEHLGSIATTIWQHVASALGIDPNLSPLEALRQGLQALWDDAAAAVAPIVQGLRDAWNWVRNESFLAPVFELIGQLPAVWQGIQDLASRVSQGVSDWFVRAAETLSRTVLPAVNGALQAVSGVVHRGIDQVDQWTAGLVATLESILSWESGIALVDALVGVVTNVLVPIRLAAQAFRSCVLRAFRSVADLMRDLVRLLRTVLDVLTGLLLAIVTFPVGLVAFLAGNVWLHVVPECYKAPILNFLLDAAVRFIRFLPEPADFLWAIVYQGVLNFLIGLRAAPDAQKVGAMNLFASIFAGNAEVAAGFHVGVGEGVWAATGGTITFLLEACAWLATLPFKLAEWAGGMLAGWLGRGPAAAGTAEAEGAAAEGAAAEGAGREFAAATAEGGEQRVAGMRRRMPGAAVIRGPPEEEETESDLQADAAEEAEELEAASREGQPPPGEGWGVPGAASDESEEVGAPSHRSDETPVGEEDEETPPPPSVRVPGAPPAPETAELRPEGPGGERPAEQPEAEEGEELAAAGPNVAEADTGGEGAGEAGPAGTEEAVSEQPPAAPGAVADLQGSLRRLVSEGPSRDDVVQLLDGARAALRGMVGRLAREGARALLNALNAQGAGFAIGRAIGAIVGQLIVQAVLAFFTGGGSAAVAALRVALTGARVTSRFAGVVSRVRRAIEPVLALVRRIRGALGELLAAVRRWLDDVLRWMRGIGRRVRRGPRGRRARPRTPRGRPRPRGRRGRRPRRRRRRNRDEARRRLAIARRVLPPVARRFFHHARGSLRTRLWLLRWKLQLRLSSLRVERGHIVARANPEEEVVRLDKLDAHEIGRALEPILARVEEQWLEERRQQMTPDRQQAVQRAEEAYVANTSRPLGLRTDEAIRFLRGVRRGEVGQGRRLRKWRTLRLGTSLRDTTQIRNPRNLAQVYQVGGPRYSKLKARHLATVSFQALVGRLEPARSPGMFAGMSVAADLENMGGITRRETIAQMFNPMAPRGAAKAADIDFFQGQQPRTRGGRRRVAQARRQRFTRLARIFQRLRRLLRATGTQLNAIQERPALRELAEAFQRWLSARFPVQATAALPDDQVQQALRALEAAILAYLRAK